MDLLDRLDISAGSETRTIELYHGDLTNMRPEEAVDILVVSAFPYIYSPAPGTLIGALWSKGVSVDQLANNCMVDLRRTSSCWLSHSLVLKKPGIEFDRILCFEPGVRGTPTQLVGDVFRSLVPFIGPKAMGTRVAMPLVACGLQSVPITDMLPPLLDAASNWMSHGLSLECLKIVVYSQDVAEQAKNAFATLKSHYQKISVLSHPNPSPEFEVFISYAHKDWETVETLVHVIEERRRDIKLFLDRTSLDPGVAWQQKIYEALERCRKVIAVLSPAYFESKRCQEEYNIAHCRAVETGDSILHPIYLRSSTLPLYIRMREYIDCREANVDLLRSSVTPDWP